MRKVLSLIVVLVFASATACAQQESAEPQDGDIVFHESKSEQSPIIKLAQQSKWTHCGIVFHIGEKAYVYEASNTVKFTPLKEWIARGKDGVYCAKRLKTPLSAPAISKMKSVGAKYKGKPYDKWFQWSDNKMYCSELVWKIYTQGADIELCTPEQFSDFNLSAPGVKKLIKERYGDSFDASERIVSPQALYKSELLKEVRYPGL